MRTTRWAWLGIGMILLATIHGNAAPDPEPALRAKDLPADVDVKSAVDLEKLAGSADLRFTDTRNRLASTTKLTTLALAFHKYADVADQPGKKRKQDDKPPPKGRKNELPGSFPANVTDKAGKQLLSWRVRLLPHLGEKALYEKFRLDEAWDSKHNLALLEKMPKAFESARVTVNRKGYTVYQVFSGPGALYESGKTKYNIGNIPDGTSNTILVVESSKAIPWTKPADLPYDAAKPIPDFGKAYGGKPLCALCDGSVRILDTKKISTATLRIAICPDDGQVLGADW